MKKLNLILALALASSTAYAQDDMKTIFNKNGASGEKTYGGYGAPFVGFTQLDKGSAIIVGGKGGVTTNHKFTFGGVGTGYIGNKNFKVNSVIDTLGGIDTINVERSISMGAGGLFFEYTFSHSSPVHISIPVNFQVGGVLAKRSKDTDDASNETKVRSSSVFIIEPGISFEFNFYKFFVPSLNVGYRYVSGDYSKQLSGVYGTAIFKFGKF